MAMGSSFDLMVQTTYLDLVERAHAAAPPAQEPGIYIERERGGRLYIYKRVYDASIGKQRDRYIGAATEALRQRLAQEAAGQQARAGRVQLVRALVAAGMPAPPAPIGRLLAGLAEAGVFRLRASLVGTHAFGLYGPLLGEQLPGALQRTLDVDIAQAPDVSLHIGDSLDRPLLEVLRGIDPGFEAITGLDPSEWPWRFATPAGLRVELLASQRGPRRSSVAPLPALRAGAHSFPFMDFLIRDPVPAVLLHGAGVPVLIPAPARYAIHKLIVATRRDAAAQAKARKDVQQAETLLRILRRDAAEEVTALLQEARGRGLAWQRALAKGIGRVADDPLRQFLADALA